VKRLRDEALVEGAVADKVAPGFEVAEVADLDFDGDARAAALDLSLADGRFAPDVLEAAARRAVAGWAEAIDGDDAALSAVASPAAVSALLHPGDPSGRTRLVVRGPRIRHVRIAALDAAAKPPTMTIDVDVTGTRYVQDRDTADVVAGSDAGETNFTERWTMALDGPDAEPWRIAGVAGATTA
jgi:predicted lipid-binding transport protein (Tim44 family)